MNDPMNYYRVAREEWREFYRNGQAPLTQDELDKIKSLNDRIFDARCSRHLCSSCSSDLSLYERI